MCYAWKRMSHFVSLIKQSALTGRLLLPVNVVAFFIFIMHILTLRLTVCAGSHIHYCEWTESIKLCLWFSESNHIRHFIRSPYVNKEIELLIYLVYLEINLLFLLFLLTSWILKHLWFATSATNIFDIEYLIEIKLFLILILKLTLPISEK